MATQLPFPTINVIPAGFRWSLAAAQKAAEKGAFIHVGGAQVTRRSLSGAERKWNSLNPEENQTAFHTTYRITGTPANIQTALAYARVPQEQINEVLGTLITKDNYQTTMRAAYDQELANYHRLMKQKPATEVYQWEQILWLGANIKSAVIATKTGEQKGAVAAPGRAGAGTTIADKIRKLGPGKVLDVSNMDLNTGKGVKTVPAPKTAKSGKFGTGRIPIISNDLNKYIRAIQLAYGPEGEATYAADIQEVRKALTFAAAPAAPAATFQFQAAVRPPSPRMVPGATLAPMPQFQAATVVPRVASPKVGTLGGGGLAAIPPLTGLF